MSLVLGTFFCFDFFIAVEFDYIGKIYTSFGVAMMMSMLFIVMLYRRKSLRGQSLSIALCKMLGTAFAFVAFYFYQPVFQKSVLLPFFYIAILIYDMIYVGMVYARCRSDRHKPGEVHRPKAVLFKKF